MLPHKNRSSLRSCSHSGCAAPGEIIRQKLADKREHQYLQRGIACYLFALDGELIIDSSMKGNSARFINHCCDVRCSARPRNGCRLAILCLTRPGAAAAELHRPRHEPRWLAADHIQHRP